VRTPSGGATVWQALPGAAARVRLMETDYYSAMLIPPFRPSESWAQTLAESLLHPDFPISFLEAFGRRFRRNYWPIFLVLALSWIGKSAFFPTAVMSWADFVSRSTAGPIPREAMLAIGAAYYLVLTCSRPHIFTSSSFALLSTCAIIESF
jgi:uncharacterized membrane protein